MRVVSDVGYYYLIPFIGGYFRIEMFREYMSDKVTYDNAEITEDFLYEESMGLFKKKYFSLFEGLD